MHNIEYIRKNPEQFDLELSRRGIEKKSAEILQLDSKVRESKTRLQELQQQKNQVVKEIGHLKSKGEDASELFKQADIIKQELQLLENGSEESNKLESILTSLPNILSNDVIDGKSEDENLEIKKWGDIPEFSFNALEHYEIGEKLGLMDFKKAADISGSRFVLLKGDLAKLERALSRFMLDILTEEYDFEEISSPLLVTEKTLYGSGQLPKFADDSFTTTDNRWLIPTSEVTLVNLVQNTILQEKELPLRFCAHTPCFRSEAGAAGKDTRGMFRMHQFNKVEMVSITHPDNSEEEHEKITTIAQTMLQRLKVPYRVVLLCSGDTGFCSNKTYDIEVWLPGQKKYREISSCSNCKDFQSRRMKARFKNQDNETNFVHTLNGSALAVGRTLIAILENYQNEDGSITIPEALREYMGQDKISML